MEPDDIEEEARERPTTGRPFSGDHLMLVIFGLSRKERPLGLIALGCTVCGHPGPQSLVHRRTRFTLFFVPVLPLRSRLETRCPQCGTTRTITRTEARRLGAD